MSFDPATSGSEIDDQALVRRMLDGEEAAFEEFFEDNFPGLYRFTLARLKDRDLTRDVVQTSITNAIAHLDSFRGEASLSGWLYTICRNEIRRHYKRSRRAPHEVELDDGDRHAALGPWSAPEDPQKGAEQTETSALVHSVLDGLPTHYGNALEWKYLDGLSVKEIAGRLKLAPKAAESLLTRARQAFKAAFASATRAPLEGWLHETGKGVTP